MVDQRVIQRDPVHFGQANLAPANGTLERYQLQSMLNFIPAKGKAAYKELIGKRFDFIEERLAKQDYVMPWGFTIADAYLFVVSGWSGHQ